MVIVTMALAGRPLQASSIGINLVGSDCRELAEIDAAGPVGQLHWNNLTLPEPGRETSAEPLKDEEGRPTSARVDSFHAAFKGTFGSLDTPNLVLMGGYVVTYLTDIEDRDNHQLVVLKIREIPYAQYSVVVYAESGNDVDVVTQVRIGTASAYLRDPAGVQFDDEKRGFVEVPAGSSENLGPDTPSGNCVVFQGLTDVMLEIRVAGTVQSDPDHPFGVISALQIIESLPSAPSH